MHHGIGHMVGYLPGEGQVGYPLPPGHQTWDPLLVTSGGDHWRPVQTCSFEDPQLVTSGGNHRRPVQTCSFEEPLLVTSGDDHWQHVQTCLFENPPC